MNSIVEAAQWALDLAGSVGAGADQALDGEMEKVGGEAVQAAASGLRGLLRRRGANISMTAEEFARLLRENDELRDALADLQAAALREGATVPGELVIRGGSYGDLEGDGDMITASDVTAVNAKFTAKRS